MDKLQTLLNRCACGVYITVNENRDYYQSVQEKLEELEDANRNDIPEDIQKKMIETDTVVSIQFYPDTPVGSYTVYHYTMDGALDLALKCLA